MALRLAMNVATLVISAGLALDEEVWVELDGAMVGVGGMGVAVGGADVGVGARDALADGVGT